MLVPINEPDAEVPPPLDANHHPDDVEDDAQVEMPDEEDAEVVPPGCRLTGSFALRNRMTVSWTGTSIFTVPVIAEGDGTLTLITLARFEEDSNGELATNVRVCDAQVPDFNAELLPDEMYGVTFPESMWDEPGIPSWDLALQAECRDPGCKLVSDAVDGLLGISLSSPNAGWPAVASAPGVAFPDHDDDGHDGITVITRGPSESSGAGIPYQHTPVSLLERAEKLMLGVRVHTVFDGMFVDCDSVAGTGPGTRVETRATACVRESGAVCDEGQAEFVDDNLPEWEVLSTEWDGVRLPDGAGCADARAAF